MTMWGLWSLQCLAWLMCSSLTSGVSFLLVFCWCIIPWKTRCHPWYACQANKGNLALFKFFQVSSLADNQYNQNSHCGANHLLRDKHYASLHFNTCRACEYITVCCYKPPLSSYHHFSNRTHMFAQVAASHSYSLPTRCGVLPLFVSTLENEWAGKCCHIVPIQAQWRVCSFPLE